MTVVCVCVGLWRAEGVYEPNRYVGQWWLVKAKACNQSRMKNFHANQANGMAAAREQNSTKEKYKLIMDMNAWERDSQRCESIDVLVRYWIYCTQDTTQDKTDRRTWRMYLEARNRVRGRQSEGWMQHQNNELSSQNNKSKLCGSCAEWIWYIHFNSANTFNFCCYYRVEKVFVTEYGSALRYALCNGGLRTQQNGSCFEWSVVQ